MWRRRDAREGKRYQREIDQEHAADDLRNGEAPADRALIVVLAMRLPDWLAPADALEQRAGPVGEIIERQDDRRRQMAVAGELEQEPAEQKTDWQASNVAE